MAEHSGQAIEAIQKSIELMQLSLPERGCEQLHHYIVLLQKWNQAFNLIARSTEVELLSRHVLDSLSVLPHLPPGRLVDVGSGAGLPGIPLAIAQPGREFTLLDANGKKIRFLNQVKAELSLDNIAIFHGRAADCRPQPRFDAVIARAFAPVSKALAETSHLCGPRGVWCLLKGPAADQELRDLPKPFTLQADIALSIPGSDAQRRLLCLQRSNTE